LIGEIINRSVSSGTKYIITPLYLGRMRPLFLLLILAELCCAACKSSRSSDNKNKDSSELKMDSAGHGTVSLADPTGETSDSISLSKLKEKFADAAIPFKGLWVNEHYIDEIRRRKSLREAQDTETKCIVIPGRTLEVTRWIYGFHEGGEGMVLVKKCKIEGRSGILFSDRCGR
jgi:hypothetical protein